MAFTYTGDLSTDRDKVRFYIPDTADGDGPQPDGTNFTDAEIDGLVSTEGSWQKAVAGAYEALAARWTKFADITAGPHRESLSQVADGYRKQAGEWRAKYGSSSRMTVGWQTKVDGYSQDVAANET